MLNTYVGRRGLLVLIGAGTLLGACDETNSPLGTPDPLTPAGIAPPVTHLIAPTDPGIDPYDTYVIIDAVQEGSTLLISDEPFVDPRNGVSVSQILIAPPAEELHIEGGYDPSGRLRVNNRNTEPLRDPLLYPVNTSRSIISVEDRFTQYDQYGYAIPEVVPAGQVPVGLLSDDLGSLVDAQITEGIVLDMQTVDTLITFSKSPKSLSPQSPLFAMVGAGSQVKVLGGDRLVITSQIFGSRSDDGPPGLVLNKTDKMEDGKRKGQIRRKYRKHEEGSYVLEEVEIEAEELDQGHTLKHRQTFRVKKLKWHENKVKDKERKERREKAAKLVSATGGPSLIIEPCIIDEWGNPCDDYTPPPPPPPPPPSSDPCPSTSSGRNVVFQHGFNSDASTWSRMDPWLSCDFYLGTKVRRSLPWKDRIGDQSGDLLPYIRNTGKSGFLMIGHSNGGLVSRSAAQKSRYSNPGLITGVVTISSPNTGATIARNGNTIINLIDGILGKYLGVTNIASFLAGNLLPVYIDDIPGSSFLNNLNATNENFRRAGIQNHAQKRWIAWRVIFSKGCYPEAGCGGRAIAKHTQRQYDEKKQCAVVGFFTLRWDRAAGCSLSVVGMNLGDYGWDLFTTSWNDRTDGFINARGQVYPRTSGTYVPENFTILNADSHVEEVRSPLVYERLRVYVLPRLGLQRRY